MGTRPPGASQKFQSLSELSRTAVGDLSLNPGLDWTELKGHSFLSLLPLSFESGGAAAKSLEGNPSYGVIA